MDSKFSTKTKTKTFQNLNMPPPLVRFLAYNIQTSFLQTFIQLLYSCVENLPKKEKEDDYLSVNVKVPIELLSI